MVLESPDIDAIALTYIMADFFASCTSMRIGVKSILRSLSPTLSPSLMLEATCSMLRAGTVLIVTTGQNFFHPRRTIMMTPSSTTTPTFTNRPNPQTLIFRTKSVEERKLQLRVEEEVRKLEEEVQQMEQELRELEEEEAELDEEESKRREEEEMRKL